MGARRLVTSDMLLDNIYDIMSNELGPIGRNVVNKQLKDLNIDKDEIAQEHLPRIANQLATAMSKFGPSKVMNLQKEIASLADLDHIVGLEKDLEKRLDMLKSMGQYYEIGGEHSQAINSYTKMQNLAIKMEDHCAECRALREIGLINIVEGDFDSAENNFQKAHEVTERSNDAKQRALTNCALGTLRWKQGQYRRGLNVLDLAIKQSNEEPEVKAIAYKVMGNIKDESGRYEESIEYQKQSIEFFKELGKEKEIITGYNNLGVAYARSDRMDEAVENYKTCIEMARKGEFVRMQGWVSFNIAELYALTGKFDDALVAAREAERIFKELGEELGMSGALMSYAVIYRERKEWKKAADYFNRTLELRKKLGTPYRIADAYREFGLMYTLQGDDQKAKRFLKRARDIFFEIGNITLANEMDALLHEL